MHTYPTLIGLAVTASLGAIALSGCGSYDSDTNRSQGGNNAASEAAKGPNWITQPVDFVNPLIGSQGVFNHRQAANVAVGASLPFGMFNFGPEHAYTEALLSESEGLKKRVLEEKVRIPVSPGGYNYDATRVKGFSFTRLSGTGCLGASGEVPVLPFLEPIKHSPDTDLMDAYYSVGYSHANESVRPGSYRITLDNGVGVNLSATERSGIAEFDFPKNADAKLLFRTAYNQLGSEKASTRFNPETGEITGSVTSGNFCGYLGEANRYSYYTLHFVAKLDVPVTSSGGWQDDKMLPGASYSEGGTGYGPKGVPELGKGSGLWLELDTAARQKVTMRVGISYVSEANARQNLITEQAHKDFAAIEIQANSRWNETLAKVKVAANPEADKDRLTTFYTALYHALHHPNLFNDVNGEYTGFDGKVHKLSAGQAAQYANYSLWDVYRSQLQLISLMEPKIASDMAQSMLNQANQYGGVWDRWTHNSGATSVMSGDPSTIAVANFVAFGADDFAVEAAYKSLYKAATEPTQFDLGNTGCPVFCRGQRPSLDQWLSLNYISDQSNSWEGASETLEQVSADFALSQLAARLGHKSQSDELLKRAGYWQNLYNPKATVDLGYIQGRNRDGSWKADFDPASPHLFVEGSPAQYLWMLPFDGAGMSALLGGDAAMEARLDSHFIKPDGSYVLFRDDAFFADVSNQPSINSPWMYLHTGAAYKTQKVVRETLNTLWLPTPKGIPGQDDLGQMSSWYVFSALGLYPMLPGRAELVLAAPVFEAAEIGKLSIRAPGASNDRLYIDEIVLNGNPSLKSFIPADYVERKTSLEFKLSDKPNPAFGQAKTERPPSFSLTGN